MARPAGFTRRAFSVWLRKQPPGTRFEACNTRHCPLAEFLQSLTSDDKAYVGVDAIYFGKRKNSVAAYTAKLPLWASKIRRAVDTGPKRGYFRGELCAFLSEKKLI